MHKMDGLVSGAGEATEISGPPPAVATKYFLTVFKSAHGEIGPRNLREGRTLCRALDLLATGQYKQPETFLHKGSRR